MKKKHLFLVAIASLAMFAACEKENEQGIVSELSVDKETIEVTYKDSTYEIAITSNVKWRISVVAADWCSLSATGGEGDSIVEVSVKANRLNEKREVKIVVVEVPTISGVYIRKDINLIQDEVFVPENGVYINGTIWAKTNVGSFGSFVATPELSGCLYQFNDTVGYQAIIPDGLKWVLTPEWKKAEWVSTQWSSKNNPCPTGWRIPTSKEVDDLIKSGATFYSPVDGYFFGPNSASATWSDFKGCVFLPFTGEALNETVFSKNSEGYYWASTDQNNGTGTVSSSILHLWREEVPQVQYMTTTAAPAYAIRCVKE